MRDLLLSILEHSPLDRGRLEKVLDAMGQYDETLLAAALSGLVAANMVTEPGTSWARYALTPDGERAAEAVVKKTDRKMLDQLRVVVNRISGNDKIKALLQTSPPMRGWMMGGM